MTAPVNERTTQGSRFEEGSTTPYRPRQLPGLGPATALFVLVYWLFFGILLQGVDLNQPPDWWQAVVSTFPLLNLVPSALIIVLSQAFSPWVLRHVLIPGLIGFWLANEVAVGFLQKFYNFSNRSEAASFLARLQRSSQEVGRPTIAAPASSKSSTHPAVVVGLITLPFAAIFFILLIYSGATPPSPTGRTVYSFLLVLLGGSWAVIIIGYALTRFMGSAPPSGLRLERESLSDMRKKQALLRVGGPGRVIVGNSDVIVTEYNGRFSRVLGPGARSLRPFEYVHSILDLRPQEREGEVVGITQDGVEVRAQVAVDFRISNDDRYFSGSDALNQVPSDDAQHPTRDRPYPYGEEAVRAAAYAETVLADGEVLTWTSLPLLIASGEFRRALGQKRLDALFDPDEDGAAAHPALLQQMTENCRRKLRNNGIQLIALRLGSLQAPEAVMDQNLSGWRSYWQKEQRIHEAEGRAQALAEIEIARQEAEMVMLRAIIEGIQRAQQDGAIDMAQDIVALRLVEALEQAAYESQDYLALEDEALEPLRILRQQLALARSTNRDELS